jgi:hypothetical protein
LRALGAPDLDYIERLRIDQKERTYLFLDILFCTCSQ